MFALHERTRLLLCRTGFLILCVLPTLFVAAAAVRYRSSDYLEARREEWASVLSDKLGLDVQLGRISYPHWNVALLEDVLLLDPETNREVLRSRYVEVTHKEGSWHITAGQPELNGAALPLLAELANYRLLGGHGVKLAPLEFEINALTVRGSEAAQTFENVAVNLVTTETGKRAQVTFHVAGMSAPQPITFTVHRQRGESGPTTTCTLDTSQSSLPCGTLAPLWPWLKQLGDHATFTGEVAFNRAPGDSLTRVTGRFEHVELDRLLSDRFPHHVLTGDAEIVLEPLELRGSMIAQMKGTLQTHGVGTVSRSLLDALADRLALAPPQPPRLNAERLVRYSHLAFGFQLDEAGLSLVGYADPAREGVIMASAAAGALLSESANPVVAPANFIRALSPQSELQVPATREAKSLFDLLPLPSLLPIDNAGDDGRPSARVRLRRSEP
jgi:hypothetical protein